MTSNKVRKCGFCRGTGDRIIVGFMEFTEGGSEFSRIEKCMICDGSGEYVPGSETWRVRGMAARKAREERGERMIDAAKRLGVTVPQLSSMELGEVDPSGLENGEIS